MGYTIGMPSLKLSNVEGKGGKHCGNFAKVLKEALKERQGIDLDIDHDLSHLNYYEGFQSAADLIAFSNKWIADYNVGVDVYNKLISAKIEDKSDPVASLKKALESIIASEQDKSRKTAEDNSIQEHGERAIAKIVKALNDNQVPKKMRKIRFDAVVMCATLLKPPQEFMATLDAEKQKEFLLDGIEKFKEIVGKDNVKSVVIHLDELVPHAHIFWQPLTPDGRLCAKEMHNLKFLGRLNREMPQYLREHGWSQIDDCHAYDAEEEQKKREEMGDKAYREHRKEQRSQRGRDSKIFKGDMDKKVEALSAEINVKEQHAKKLDDEIVKKNSVLVS